MKVITKDYAAYKVAGVQAAPVYLDLNETVIKTVSLIDEAASNGAKLIGFPESFIPGYPWWIWLGTSMENSIKFYEILYNNAVTIPGNAVRSISEAARKNSVYVCVSVTELDGGSLYLTQLWFNPQGDLIGKHRKFKPTSFERAIWGEGDGSMAPVFDTEFGRLGGLQCAEHMIPLNLTAMNSLNEQVHIASWPAFVPDENSLLSQIPCETATCYYTTVNQTYSIMCSQIFTEEMQEMLIEREEQMNFINIGGGCTKIFSPQGGQVISNEIASDEEGIAYADIDLSNIPSGKFIMDPAGHYSTPGFLRMIFDRTPIPPVTIIGEQGNNFISYAQIQETEDIKIKLCCAY